jgi:hypothetical protein
MIKKPVALRFEALSLAAVVADTTAASVVCVLNNGCDELTVVEPAVVALLVGSLEHFSDDSSEPSGQERTPSHTNERCKHADLVSTEDDDMLAHLN